MMREKRSRALMKFWAIPTLMGSNKKLIKYEKSTEYKTL